MKEVFYKGKPYQFTRGLVNGVNKYILMENGVIKHAVEESELDVKTIVSLIVDQYYRNQKSHA